MKKVMVLTAIAAACTAAATGQTLAPQDAAAMGQVGSDSSAPMPPADVRAAELNKMMNIRGWQAGPSAGDAAARASSATPMATDTQRAAGLQSQMEIRGWQTGPSSGDSATSSVSKATVPPATVRLATPGEQRTVIENSTP
jgi:hypothetical protein